MAKLAVRDNKGYAEAGVDSRGEIVTGGPILNVRPYGSALLHFSARNTMGDAAFMAHYYTLAEVKGEKEGGADYVVVERDLEKRITSSGRIMELDSVVSFLLKKD